MRSGFFSFYREPHWDVKPGEPDLNVAVDIRRYDGGAAGADNPEPEVTEEDAPEDKLKESKVNKVVF